MNKNYLQLIDAGKTYSGGYRSLGYVSFALDEGDRCVFLGSAISGKTSLLAIISGLERVSSGTIMLNNENITNCLIKDRDIGLISCDLPFFDNKDVLYNLRLPQLIRKIDDDDINERLQVIIRKLI